MGGGCPIDHSSSSSDPVAPNDPNTNLPFSKILESNFFDKEKDGTAGDLSNDRVTSTIPRTDSPDNWKYPSPHMFQQALKRKGYGLSEGKDVESMVSIHNFLNEAVWEQVMEWEKMHCEECSDVSLKRFQGKPTEYSPLARFYNAVYGSPLPFDRHDWTVNRCGKPVRYIIDYYTSGVAENGMPAFNVNVRPALDSFESFVDRAKRFWREKFE